MNRPFLAAAALSVVLLAGCAATGMSSSDDSDLAERVRQELGTDPMLNSSQVTVTERDGVIIIGGFVEDLQDLNAIRDTIASVEGVGEIENNVIVQGE